MDPHHTTDVTPPPRWAAPTLIVVGVAATLLGVYQWVALMQLRTQNTKPLCALNEQLDCGAVWDSPLAAAVHAYTGLPFAAWGVAWGLVITLFAVGRVLPIKGVTLRAAIAAALRLTAAVGAIVVLGLLLYSMTLSVFCLTCVLFYLLVGIAAAVAFRATPRAAGAWRAGIGLALAVLVAVTIPLLYPGLKTPREHAAVVLPVDADSVTAADRTESLRAFLRGMPAAALKAMSNSLARYRLAPRVDIPPAPERILHGQPGSAVRMIEWIEIECPHCRRLHDNMAVVRTKLEELSLPLSWSEEVRFFPLDSECNPHVQRTSGDGVSCLAARLMICLGGGPRAATVLDELFSHQSQLSRARIWDTAAEAGANAESLENCVGSEQTETVLQNDIAYAIDHHIEGTPLVAINGRAVDAYPAMIYLLILAQGNDDEPAFRQLPPPAPLGR